SMAEQQRRLREAAAVLGVLRQAANDPTSAWQELEPLVAPKPSGESTALRELWDLPIRFAKGVGPKRAATLHRLRIQTVEDALWTVAWRYEDRSVMTPIGNLIPGMVTSIYGVVVKNDTKRTRNRRVTVTEVCVEDQSGRMQAVFFNQSY